MILLSLFGCVFCVFLFLFLFLVPSKAQVLNGLRHIYLQPYKPANIPTALSGETIETILTGGGTWPALGVTCNTIQLLPCLEP